VTPARYLLLGCGLLVLLGLAFADFKVKHETVVGPSTRLQSDGPRATRPLDPERMADGLPDRMFWDDDAYYWISYARASIEQRTLRLRHSTLDNAPDGREIHWCSGPTWLLLALAGPVHLVVQGSLDEALSVAALGVHPLLFTLLLIGTALLIARRAGPLAALALSACFLLTPVLSRDMSYGTLDHHALLLLCTMGTLLCLLLGGAGFVRGDGGNDGDGGWIVASAICAGAGLWVQAIFQSLLIAGILIGAMLGGLRSTSVPELWRTWGRVGAATSMAFYLVESFPSNLGMRLEVNHPLYALALLAGGELTFRVLRRLNHPSRKGLIADLPLLALCGLGALSPALAVLLGPADWFWLRDPLLQRVHESIIGYQPASVLLFQSGPVLRTLLSEFGILPLFAVYALFVLVRGKDGTRCARITVVLIPTLVTLALYLRFARNGGLALVALIGLAAALLIPSGPSHGGGAARRAVVPLLAGVLLLCSGLAWYLSWQTYQPFVGTDRFGPGWVRKMGYRDLARELRARLPQDQRLVLTGADLAPTLHYFGDFAVTSGLYWENREGLRATAEFFAAHDDEQARAIVERRGIRYVIFWAGPPAVARWHRLVHGHADPESVQRTLGYRLAGSEQVPGWLQEISAEFPRTALPFRVKIYRVQTLY